MSDSTLDNSLTRRGFVAAAGAMAATTLLPEQQGQRRDAVQARVAAFELEERTIGELQTAMRSGQ